MLRRVPPVVAMLLSLSLLLTGCGPTKTAGNATGTSQSRSQAPAASPLSTAGASASTTADALACPTSNAKVFAKTRFVLHTGEGFGAFHRHLYKPYKAGSFASGSSGRIKNFVKAGLAALFIKRQIRLASEDVKANPALCNAIAAPLARIGNSIDGPIRKLKGGDRPGWSRPTAASVASKGPPPATAPPSQKTPTPTSTANGQPRPHTRVILKRGSATVGERIAEVIGPIF